MTRLNGSNRSGADIFVHRLIRRGRRMVRAAIAGVLDRTSSTYGEYHTGAIAQLLPSMNDALPDELHAQITSLARLYCQHHFDLLGSGWTQVRYGMQCRGLEGHRYTAPSIDITADALVARLNRANQPQARIIRTLIDQDFVPIDWHLDFKSGYRWDERTPFRAIHFAHEPGVDVKVPWELARMQHLPMLAWAYILGDDGSDRSRAAYVREFRNQILDFIAQNPPRFGVNWVTAMDVAIRAINWLVCYDLMRAAGATFDGPFEREFGRSIRAHGSHIRNNLERHGDNRGNHYLADIVGLVFIASFLPADAQTNGWLTFAAHELRGEVLHQFNRDGSNFEASTSYHRLSAEAVAYAIALLRALPLHRRALFEDPVDSEVAQRLAGMASFTCAITKPDGTIAQIGDNDSGRMLKLHPLFHRRTVAEARGRFANLEGYRELSDDAVYWEEDHLNHTATIDALSALFGGRGESTDGRLIARLVENQPLTAPPAEGDVMFDERASESAWQQLIAELGTRSDASSVQFGVQAWTYEDLTLHRFTDFGLYIFRAAEFFLSVRCGGNRREPTGAHAHNDELAIELTVGDRHRTRDPGTYLYTPLPSRRNEYRSVHAHAVPHSTRREPARLDEHVFKLSRTRAECLYFGRRGFIGRHYGYGDPVYRVLELQQGSVGVVDYGAAMRLDSVPAFSPGYGIRFV